MRENEVDSQRRTISVVSPVYMGEEFVAELVERSIRAIEACEHEAEIILVDDRGPDDSWEKICAESEKDDRVKGVRLSRNHGQHPAIRAGLDFATGDWVVVMDCDLQDRPEEIPRLLEKAERDEVELVVARRVNKQFSSAKKFTSTFFYRVLAYLTDAPQDSAIGNFGIYSKKVIDGVRSMPQQSAFFPAMIQRLGFSRSRLDVEHAARASGESSYSFSALIGLAMTILLGASDKPLRLAVGLGMICSGLGFLYAAYVVLRVLLGGTVVLGWASTIVSIWFLAGVVISLLGLIGLTVGQVLRESQRAPVYHVEDMRNVRDQA